MEQPGHEPVSIWAARATGGSLAWCTTVLALNFLFHWIIVYELFSVHTKMIFVLSFVNMCQNLIFILFHQIMAVPLIFGIHWRFLSPFGWAFCDCCQAVVHAYVTRRYSILLVWDESSLPALHCRFNLKMPPLMHEFVFFNNNKLHTSALLMCSSSIDSYLA